MNCERRLLVLARRVGDEVDHRVGVGGDEVDRPVAEPLLLHRRAHRRPPAAGHARVAGLRAAEHPDPQVEPRARDLVEERREVAPRLADPHPVLGRAAERVRAGRRVGIAGRALGRAQRRVQLVPLDLVGDERRDQVVEVGRRRQQHRHRALVAVEPPAPAGGRLDRLPVLDRAEAGARERLRLLAHDDHGGPPDRGRQAPQRVQERAEIDVARRRQRVQARVHRAVRRLEHPQQRLAGRAQQRRVRPVVELDLVREQARVLSQGAAGNVARHAQAGDGHGGHAIR